MDMLVCPGCGDATFELDRTAYGLCLGCEAKMTPTLELVVIFPDEVIRVNADDAGLIDTVMLIDDVEADGGTFVWQRRMVLRLPLPEIVLI